MKEFEIKKFFGIDDILDLPNAAMQLVMSPAEERNERYKELLKINNYDMGADWFQEAFEESLTERKTKKQDFTPIEVNILLANLTGEGTIHEPTAGTGGALIAKWWNECLKKVPFDYYPSQNRFSCWEISDRSVPILILNLSIRGMVGEVYHGDVLEKDIKAVYLLNNRKDDALGFSDVVKI